MSALPTSLLLTSLLILSSPAQAHPARLLDALAAIDVIPTREQLTEAGASEAVLLAVATDATLPRYTRARASAMLGVFSTRPALDALRGLSVDTKLDKEVRIQALFALAFVASALGATEATDVLAKVASADPDVELRELAKRARATVTQAPRAPNVPSTRVVNE